MTIPERGRRSIAKAVRVQPIEERKERIAMNPDDPDTTGISQQISRRTVLLASALPIAGAAIGVGLGRAPVAAQTPTASPVSGNAVPELADLDRAVAELIAKWRLPGAQLAVARSGRLVFDRGYGFADLETGDPVRPDHRFRIASVTKTITAVGVLRLVERGDLSLDDAVFPLLDLQPPPGANVDPRIAQITVKDLLVHAGGWNDQVSGDPQYWPICVAAAVTLGDAGPPSPETIIRFWLGAGLDFDPGTESVYSNFGFNVAGRVIEHVSGQPYETFIQHEILGPAGASGMQLGKTHLADRAENEVHYYAPAEFPPTVPSVFPGEGYAPWAYGYFYLPAMDAHGGWIATMADLLRYATALDGQRGEPLLQTATVERMVSAARPPAEGLNGAANPDPATGLGWVVQPGPTGLEWAHTGALGGSTSALLLRLGDGTWFAFVANSLPVDLVTIFGELRKTLTTGASQVRSWPDGDLFDSAL
jgi:N-acyl-D-amino-acid deacylase